MRHLELHANGNGVDSQNGYDRSRYGNRIECAFVFGSVAAGRDRANSDIDLMVAAHSLDYATLFDALRVAEQALDRPVNPMVVSPAEWQRKRRGPDGFMAPVAKGPRLWVFGEGRAARICDELAKSGGIE